MNKPKMENVSQSEVKKPQESSSQTLQIEKFKNLHVTVDEECDLIVQVQEGLAEINGSYLHKDTKYKFLKNSRFSIFTYTGCVVVLDGKAKHNISEKKMIKQHVALCKMLDSARRNLHQVGQLGPRILVVGPQDMGKTTLCKYLVNWAARKKSVVRFVDFDIGQNAVTIPGIVAMSVVDKPLHPVNEFHNKDLLAYHFGHKSPHFNQNLYSFLIKRMASIVNYQDYHYADLRYGGCVINTCGWVVDFGFESICNIAQAFEVQYILVLGDPSLGSQIKSVVPRGVHVMNINKDDMVVERSRTYRRNSRRLKLDQYFYGLYNDQKPHMITIPSNKLKIFAVGSGISGNEKRIRNSLNGDNLTKVNIDESLNDKVLSIVDDTFGTGKNYSNLLGYVLVESANKHSITLITPKPGPFPFRKFLCMWFKTSEL